MKTVTFYRLSDGRLAGRFTGPEEQIDANVPAGAGWVEGDFDAATHRVNVATGSVVERPAAEIAAEQAAHDRLLRVSAARAEIADLEARQQRAIREHAIGRGGTPSELRKRLEDIDDQIIALRQVINN